MKLTAILCVLTRAFSLAHAAGGPQPASSNVPGAAYPRIDSDIYFESPGTAHEWLTWRRDLNDFAPRPFH